MNNEPNTSLLEKSQPYNACFVYSLVLNAVMGSFFFGYIMGIFNTAQSYMTTVVYPDMSDTVEYLMTSFVPLGAGVGAYLAGHLSQKTGRRKAMLITDFISIVGVAIQLLPNVYLLLTGRLICGFCVGLNSTLVPQYINEVAPIKVKGIAGTMVQVFLNIGILGSYLIANGLPDNFQPGDTPVFFWKVMFGFPFVTCGIRVLFLLVAFNQDTPKYCVMNGNEDEASTMLKRIYPKEYALEHLIQLRRSKELEASHETSSDNNETSKKAFSKRFRAGVLLSVFQQTCGINAIIFYSQTIFENTSGADEAHTDTIIVGVVNLCGTIIASTLIEKAGRKFLCVFGSISMGVILTVFAVVGLIDNKSAFLSFLIYGYVVSFGLSLGPVVWPYIAELLFDKGVNISVLGNWATAFCVAQGFPYLTKIVGTSSSFFVFAGLSFLSAFYIGFNIPETKGKSDAEIKELFSSAIQIKEGSEVPLRGESRLG